LKWNTNDLEDILDLERGYIEEFSKWYKLTNSTSGGESSKTFTQNVKDKISLTLKEHFKSNDVWNKGLNYKMDEEVKIKRRIGIGDKIDGENNHFYGKHHSLETRKLVSSKNRKYEYNYDIIYNYYIVKNMNTSEISKELNLPYNLVKKKIFKYNLKSIKKNIYGKIRGEKIYIDDMELLYRYYDHNRF